MHAYVILRVLQEYFYFMNTFDFIYCYNDSKFACLIFGIGYIYIGNDLKKLNVRSIWNI